VCVVSAPNNQRDTKQTARKLQLVSLVDHLIEEGKEKQALCQTTPKKNTPCTPAEQLERAAHEREGQQTMTNLHSLLSWHITENRNSIRIERARPRKTKQQSRPHFTTSWPIFANCAIIGWLICELGEELATPLAQPARGSVGMHLHLQRGQGWPRRHAQLGKSPLHKLQE